MRRLTDVDQCVGQRPLNLLHCFPMAELCDPFYMVVPTGKLAAFQRDWADAAREPPTLIGFDSKTKAGDSRVTFQLELLPRSDPDAQTLRDKVQTIVGPAGRRAKLVAVHAITNKTLKETYTGSLGNEHVLWYGPGCRPPFVVCREGFSRNEAQTDAFLSEAAVYFASEAAYVGIHHPYQVPRREAAEFFSSAADVPDGQLYQIIAARVAVGREHVLEHVRSAGHSRERLRLPTDHHSGTFRSWTHPGTEAGPSTDWTAVKHGTQAEPTHLCTFWYPEL